jgi:two-component system chemotaxis sensor kinase CheA
MNLDLTVVYQQFQMEAEEQLSAMEEGILSLEHHPQPAEALQTLFRLAHSLKGNALMLGLGEISQIAERVEDVLDGLREGRFVATADLGEILLRTLQSLRRATRQVVASPAASSPVLELLEGQGNTENSPQPSAFAEPSAPSTLRVPIAQLDRLMNLAGELSIAREALAQLLRRYQKDTALQSLSSELERLVSDLREHARRVRVVPIAPVLRMYARVARDAALSYGKEVALVSAGEDTSLDAAIVEQLRDPLTQMIRNAVAHGIEPPEERAALGKPRQGTITIEISRVAGGVLISVADDGRGFSVEKIRARAKARGLDAENLSEQELLRFVFEPGFSTADEVTSLSGRGVGMDLVRDRIEGLRGSVHIESQQGKGSAVTLRLPLSLLLVEGFLLGVGASQYLVPRDSVLACVELPDALRGAPRGTLLYQEREVPFFDLRGLFRIEALPAARQSVVLVRHGRDAAGLVVDGLYEEIQGVVKPLGPLLRTPRWFSGAMLLADGRIALILEPSALLREGLSSGGGGR